MPLVYLDTNIYRQIGLKFIENIDYQNLTNILESSGNEFGLLEVVKYELLDYYKYDIFNAILSDHEKLYKRYQLNPYLDEIEIPQTTIPLSRAIQKVEKDLRADKYYSKLPEIQPQLLLDFLLSNKRSTRKDNTRDFLIFYTLIELCKEHRDNFIVLISQDDIFKSNEFFNKVRIREKVDNLKVFNSISEFLKDFGPKFEWLTPELLLQHIDTSVVKTELLNDIKSLPSYISNFYYEKKEEDIPDIEQLEIFDVSIHNFYVVKDYKTEVLKVNVSVKVKLKQYLNQNQIQKNLQIF